MLESILDTLFYWIFYSMLDGQILTEIIFGSFLLNGMFFLVPGTVYGIIKKGFPAGVETEIKSITIRDGATEHVVPVSDVFFIRSEGNYVLYQTRKKKIMIRKSLKSIEEELREPFIRCHKSYIVNYSLIEQKTYSELVISGYHIPIGRSYRKLLPEFG